MNVKTAAAPVCVSMVGGRLFARIVAALTSASTEGGSMNVKTAAAPVCVSMVGGSLFARIAVALEYVSTANERKDVKYAKAPRLPRALSPLRLQLREKSLSNLRKQNRALLVRFLWTSRQGQSLNLQSSFPLCLYYLP